MVGERGFEPPTPWSRIQGAGTNFVATQSFKWCFNRLILAQPCHSGMNVSPRTAVPNQGFIGALTHFSFIAAQHSDLAAIGKAGIFPDENRV